MQHAVSLALITALSRHFDLIVEGILYHTHVNGGQLDWLRVFPEWHAFDVLRLAGLVVG